MSPIRVVQPLGLFFILFLSLKRVGNSRQVSQWLYSPPHLPLKARVPSLQA